MAESKQQVGPAGEKVFPLGENGDVEEEWVETRRSKGFLHRRRCVAMIFGGVASFLVIVGTIVVALAFTVYRIREPIMNIEAIEVQRRDGSGGSGGESSGLGMLFGNSTVEITASVKNPNSVAYYYDRSVTSIYYDGNLLSESPGPTGKTGPRRTHILNVTVHVSRLRVDDATLRKALRAGEITVEASTMVDGHAMIFGFIRHQVDVLFNCTVELSVANLAILGQKCREHVWI